MIYRLGQRKTGRHSFLLIVITNTQNGYPVALEPWRKLVAKVRATK